MKEKISDILFDIRYVIITALGGCILFGIIRHVPVLALMGSFTGMIFCTFILKKYGE